MAQIVSSRPKEPEEPKNLSIEEASNGYVLNRRYGENRSIAATLDEALKMAKKYFGKKGK